MAEELLASYERQLGNMGQTKPEQTAGRLHEDAWRAFLRPTTAESLFIRADMPFPKETVLPQRLKELKEEEALANMQPIKDLFSYLTPSLRFGCQSCSFSAGATAT